MHQDERFFFFALRSLYRIAYIQWDSFLPSLLSSVTSAEMSANPESSLISIHGIGSPSQSSANETSYTALSPSKSLISIVTLRKLSCEIISYAMESNLNPSTHADIFHQMMKWLVNLDHKNPLSEWLHKCLNVVYMLVDENKCRVPFYELLRSELQFMENLPDNKSLFTLILEVHRRRDMMAMILHFRFRDEVLIGRELYVVLSTLFVIRHHLIGGGMCFLWRHVTTVNFPISKVNSILMYWSLYVTNGYKTKNLPKLADCLLQSHSSFLHHCPLHFTFVRDILAYFYGHLPRNLVLRIINILDVKKIPFSDSFSQYMNSSNDISQPPLEYFTSRLSNLVNNVIPPLPPPTTNNSESISNSNFKLRKPFYQIQDPGTHTQLLLETALIEILSLPVTPTQIISSFVNIITSRFHIQPKVNPLSNSNTPCLMIQACGLLLAQLPVEFHTPLYADMARVIKESSFHMDGGYGLLDPTWTCQENTPTALGVLRIAFRVIGPLLPRLANAHSLFTKTLDLLLSMMVDVFGRNSQSSSSSSTSTLDITDLIDFL
ncbi:hypothetical protein LXL04_011381 [Taraxacum kok-saghyz]